MEKKRELEAKTNKISQKMGALFIKELINKQYKLNYYQKVQAQSQAFYTWKKAIRQARQEGPTPRAKISPMNKSHSRAKKGLKIKAGCKSAHRGSKSMAKMRKMYIDKNKILVNSIKNQNSINLNLEQEIKARNRHIRTCKVAIGLKALSIFMKEKTIVTKTHALNKLKNATNFDQHRLVNISNLNSMQENEESEIHTMSEHDLRDEDHFVHKILSKFTPSKHSPSSASSENAESECNSRSQTQKSYKIDFHEKKPPLSIEIAEKQETEEAVVLDSNGNFRSGDESDDPEEEESNCSPFLARDQPKMSPFENPRRRLIINTDSMDSGNIRCLKNPEDNSANNMMLKRRNNPPQTLTTNATTNKHNEAGVGKALPSQSADSKKAGDMKSLEQIDDEYTEHILRAQEEPNFRQFGDHDDPYFENDLIVEEEIHEVHE